MVKNMSSAGLSLSALAVLHELVTKGPMTPKQIRQKVTLSPRSVSDALRRLTVKQICRKVPNLHDMRQPLYCVESLKVKELHISINQIRAMTSIYLKMV
ncbi:MAG: MarR family transcriptional regulator [Candidatus Thorarchaeota archaeon]